MKRKIRKGDTVEIISGRSEEKGKRGEVIKIYRTENRVAVQGINIRVKHQGDVQAQGRTMSPGIIEFEAPLHLSNVLIVCPKCDKASRVGVQRDEDGVAHRVCKSCDEQID